METAKQLDSFSVIARALVGGDPLAERLQAALTALHHSAPFEWARITVLSDAPWAYVVPAGQHRAPIRGDRKLLVPWPARWTTKLLDSRTSWTHDLTPYSRYLGWPILWQGTLFGALELVVPCDNFEA